MELIGAPAPRLSPVNEVTEVHQHQKRFGPCVGVAAVWPDGILFDLTDHLNESSADRPFASLTRDIWVNKVCGAHSRTVARSPRKMPRQPPPHTACPSPSLHASLSRGFHGSGAQSRTCAFVSAPPPLACRPRAATGSVRLARRPPPRPDPR